MTNCKHSFDHGDSKCLICGESVSKYYTGTNMIRLLPRTKKGRTRLGILLMVAPIGVEYGYLFGWTGVVALIAIAIACAIGGHICVKFVQWVERGEE